MDLTLLVSVFIAIVISVILHEVVHGFVALQLGDHTARLSGRLTLNPLVHIDPFATIILPILLVVAGLPPFGAAKPVPIDPGRLRYDEFGMALVAVAGPLTNFLLAVAMALTLRLGIDVFPSPVINFGVIFVQVNLSFFVFNMIPFPPLDGSRLLYAFAPEPVQDLLRFIESFGLFAIAAFMFLVFPLVSPIMIDLVQSLQAWLL